MNTLAPTSENQSHGTVKVPWLTLGLTLLTIILYLAGPVFFNHLVFLKGAIEQQLWRCLTGHFVHCNVEHLFWDVVALVILGSAIELKSRGDLLLSLFISCVSVSLWLLWGEPRLQTYCGLSGALNGMLVMAAVTYWQETKNKMYLMIIAATIGKIILELTTHQTIFTNLASQAVPGAHAAGMVGGLGYVLYSYLKKSQIYPVLITRKSHNN